MLYIYYINFILFYCNNKDDLMKINFENLIFHSFLSYFDKNTVIALL